MGHELFSGVWSNTSNKTLSKQMLKIRTWAKWMNSINEMHSLSFLPSQWRKSHWQHQPMIWNRNAGKLKFVQAVSAQHRNNLPPKTITQTEKSNTKLNTHSQTKECDFDLQDKKQHDQQSVLQLMWTIHRDIFSQHTCFSCSKWELFLKNTTKIHKKQNLLWAFHRIYRGCLGSWCNFMLSQSIWIRTYLLSSDIQLRGIWTGECTKAFQ